jgi:hypothetical protein
MWRLWRRFLPRGSHRPRRCVRGGASGRLRGMRPCPGRVARRVAVRAALCRRRLCRRPRWRRRRGPGDPRKALRSVRREHARDHPRVQRRGGESRGRGSSRSRGSSRCRGRRMRRARSEGARLWFRKRGQLVEPLRRGRCLRDLSQGGSRRLHEDLLVRIRAVRPRVLRGRRTAVRHRRMRRDYSVPGEVWSRYGLHLRLQCSNGARPCTPGRPPEPVPRHPLLAL